MMPRSDLQLSPDGRWLWDGQQWLPAPAQSAPPSTAHGLRATDIMVCFDTTGSMDDIIGSLIRQTGEFVTAAAREQMGLRFGLVAFGDIRVAGDRIVRYPFTADPLEFTGGLRQMPRFSGGANRGETSLDALSVVAGHPGWLPMAVRLCVLITDEPPVGKAVTLEAVGRALRDQRIVVFPVSVSHRAFDWLAQVTGGEWWDIEQPVPFDRLFARLARRLLQRANELWPRLTAGTRS